MTFQDLLSIWASLAGKKIQSIRRGADITIESVDFSHDRIVVRSRSGDKSRSFAELERVWKALKRDRFVHVDSVLGGSGSSRNQPETLFAALPFVEWTSIDRKKHIVLAGSDTHPPGTLKKAAPDLVAEVRALSAARKAASPELVIPVADVRQAAAALERLSGQPPEAEVPGEYLYLLAGLPVRIVAENAVDASLRGRAIIRGVVSPEHASDGPLEIGTGVVVEPQK